MTNEHFNSNGLSPKCYYHKDHESRIERSESDIQKLWGASDSVKEEIKKVLVKFSWLMGTLTAVNAIVMLLIQFTFKQPNIPYNHTQGSNYEQTNERTIGDVQDVARQQANIR